MSCTDLDDKSSEPLKRADRRGPGEVGGTRAVGRDTTGTDADVDTDGAGAIDRSTPDDVGDVICGPDDVITSRELTPNVVAIDPDGDGSHAPFAVHCDMTTDGGGWTLVMNRDTASGATASSGLITPSDTGTTMDAARLAALQTHATEATRGSSTQQLPGGTARPSSP